MEDRAGMYTALYANALGLRLPMVIVTTRLRSRRLDGCDLTCPNSGLANRGSPIRSSPNLFLFLLFPLLLLAEAVQSFVAA